jgi:hypothetical protein
MGTESPLTAAVEQALISERCARCRLAIEVCSPDWYRLDLDLANRRVQWLYDPDESALCIACALAAADTATRPSLELKLAALVERKRPTGVPDTVTMFHHRTQSTYIHGPTHGRFIFDWYFVHLRDELPNDSSAPRLSVTQDNGAPPLVLLFLGWDISLKGVPAVARYTWNATDVRREGRLHIDGWSLSRHADLMRLLEAGAIFYERATPGRPRGSTVLTYDDYERLFQEVSTKLGRPPSSLREFVREMEPGVSEDTVKRNMKQYQTTWGQFRKLHSSG